VYCFVVLSFHSYLERLPVLVGKTPVLAAVNGFYFSNAAVNRRKIKQLNMWRPLFRKECLKPGDKLRKELLIGEDRLWTEYEVMETGEECLLLKPLASNGNVHHDNPAGYKKMHYEVLYASSTRIWVAMEKPAPSFSQKEDPVGNRLPDNTVQAEQLAFTFSGLRPRKASPHRMGVLILVMVLLFFMLIIVQVALRR